MNWNAFRRVPKRWRWLAWPLLVVMVAVWAMMENRLIDRLNHLADEYFLNSALRKVQPLLDSATTNTLIGLVPYVGWSLIALMLILVTFSNVLESLTTLRSTQPEYQSQNEANRKSNSSQSGVSPTSSVANSFVSNYAKPSGKSPGPHRQPAVPDAGKIAFIDAAFRQIEDQCLPIFDRYCDKTLGPWRSNLRKGTRSQFILDSRADIQASAVHIGALITLANRNRLYFDVYDELKDIGDVHNSVGSRFNDLVAKLIKLPEKIPEEALDLVAHEGDELQKAIGAYGQWLRTKSQRLVELRKAELLGQ